MHVLFTTSPSVGHFHPLVPIARALESAGHLVAFAALPSFAPRVEACGFRFFPVGPDVRDFLARPEMQEYVNETDPMAKRELVRGYVNPVLLPQLILPDVMAWCESWTPDMIVTENYEFAGRVAAERFDVPHAALQVADYFGYGMRHDLVAPMDALRMSVGLSPDPDATMLFRYVYLVNEPESLLSDDDLPPTVFRCRRMVFDESGDERLPAWFSGLPPRPTVCATVGTAVNRTPGVLETFVAALRDEPVNAIVAIGRDRDPADFLPPSDNIHVERYIPLSLALPACDVLLSHCGRGTMFTALDNGLPMVNVPIGMDQPENAERCAALHLGITVEPAALSVDAIRAAVRAVLADPSYGQNARRIQTEMHALPPPSAVVTLLEALARNKEPFERLNHTPALRVADR